MILTFVLKEDNKEVEVKKYPEWQNPIPEKGSTVTFIKPNFWVGIISSIDWLELPASIGRYYFEVIIVVHKLNDPL